MSHKTVIDLPIFVFANFFRYTQIRMIFVEYIS